MRILLTGGTGMVGQNILENNQSKDYLFFAPRRNEMDLLDIASIEKTIKEINPDLIIHTAAKVGGIMANIKDPLGFFEQNCFMGLNLIKASYENNVNKLLNFGSSCMYPFEAENPLNEKDILNGYLEPTNEGYALSKIISYKYCKYLNSIEGFSYKTIVPCNLYGKYDDFDLKSSHLIPAIIKKIHDAKVNNKKEVEIWGDGKARREFMSASELSDFVFYALKNFQKLPEVLNVGTGKDHTVEDYYFEVAKVIGYKGNFIYDLSKPKGMKQKKVDINSLKKFGWSSKLNLNEGIIEAYDFFLKSNNEI